MHIIEKKFLDNISKYKLHKNLYIAFSGGVDSSVLLYLCYKFLKKKHNIRLLHVDYSYSSFNSWSYFVKNKSDFFYIPVHLYKLKLSIKKNIEEEFRVIRFNLFLKIILRNSTLLLAHHLDDYIETFFFRLFRGVGPDKLFSFNILSKIFKLNILRPLIFVRKDLIKNYAALNKINHVYDFTNFSDNIDRNYVRNKVLNVINIKWYKFDKQIVKFSLLINNYFFYIYYRKLFFIKSKGFNFNFLRIDYLFLLPKFIRINIFRFWLKINSIKLIYYINYDEIENILFSRKNNIFHRFRGFIIIKINNILFFEKNVYLIFNNISLYKKKKNSFIKFHFLKFDKHLSLMRKSNIGLVYNFYNKCVLLNKFLFKELF